MNDPNREYFLNSGLFEVLKLTSTEKITKLNDPHLQGEWRVFNTFPQSGNPMDETERYFLYPDYVHEYEENDDNEEVTLIFLLNIFVKPKFNYESFLTLTLFKYYRRRILPIHLFVFFAKNV